MFKDFCKCDSSIHIWVDLSPGHSPKCLYQPESRKALAHMGNCDWNQGWDQKRHVIIFLSYIWGLVEWCEGVTYLSHWGVQLILAYSWARPAILVADKGRGGMFLFLLFLHFHSCSSFFPVPLFHLFYYLFYLFSPFLWETTQNHPQGLTCR